MSIIIPVYNVQDYIEETLNSLLNADVKETELVIIDDCSEDSTAEVISTWLETHQINFQLIINQKNCGPSTARNHGLSLARGKYITYFDGDDIAVSSVYSEALDMMDCHDIEFCILRASSFDHVTQNIYGFPDHNIWENIFNKGEEYKISTVVREPRIANLAPNVMSRIYKKDFLIEKKLVFPDGLIFEDLYFHANCIFNSNKILLLNKTLLLYRVNRKGQLTSFTAKNQEDILVIIEQIIDNYHAVILDNIVWSNLVDLMIKLAIWCSENSPYDEKRNFIIKFISIFSKIPRNIFDTYIKYNDIDEWERNVVVACKINEVNVLINVSEGGFPVLPSEEIESETVDLHVLNDKIELLTSQQRDGWANDRFNMLNNKLDNILTVLRESVESLAVDYETNHLILNKLNDLVSPTDQNIDTENNSAPTIYEKILNSINEIKNNHK